MIYYIYMEHYNYCNLSQTTLSIHKNQLRTIDSKTIKFFMVGKSSKKCSHVIQKSFHSIDSKLKTSKKKLSSKFLKILSIFRYCIHHLKKLKANGITNYLCSCSLTNHSASTCTLVHGFIHFV